MFSSIGHAIIGTISALIVALGFSSIQSPAPIQEKTPSDLHISQASTTVTATKTTIERQKTKFATSSTAQNKSKTQPKPQKTTSAAAPVSKPILSVPIPAQTATQTKPSFDKINENVRPSLVNIFCRNNVGMTITGTGTVISPSGVILTNAHIGQYFALEYTHPSEVYCWLRTGSPAREAYKASLLYISNKWVLENAGNQQEEDPSGTGEHDFALLLVATSTTSRNNAGELVSQPTPQQNLPPALSYETKLTPTIDQPVLVAGYSAGFLGASEIERNLYISSSITNIEGIYTFEPNDRPIDLFMMNGSISAQKGTSGGAVVDANGKLIGIVSIVTKGKTTNERLLGAITIQHIMRSFEAETEFSLTDYISGSHEVLQNRSARFNEFSSKITTILSTKNASSSKSTTNQTR